MSKRTRLLSRSASLAWHKLTTMRIVEYTPCQLIGQRDTNELFRHGFVRISRVESREVFDHRKDETHGVTVMWYSPV